MGKNVPIGWPKHFNYSPVSISVDIPDTFLRHLLSSDNPASQGKISDLIEKKCAHPDLRIRKITKSFEYLGPMPHPLSDSEIFPGHEQHGVFAESKIPERTELGEYVGEISFGWENLTPLQYFKGVHCWVVRFGTIYLNISSGHIANELAFINDYRGLRDRPNVQPKWILSRGVYYFGYETTKDVEPMEELLADYGKTFEMQAVKEKGKNS